VAARTNGSGRFEVVELGCCRDLGGIRASPYPRRHGGSATVRLAFRHGISAVSAPVFQSIDCMVRPEGFEPPTPRLGTARSTDLVAAVRLALCTAMCNIDRDMLHT
jgi:hypothetical protein